MTIKLSDKQEEAVNAIASGNYDFILYGGAMGGGKTWWGLLSLLFLCRIYPGSRWCVIRENLNRIRLTTIPSFKRINPSGKLRENPYEYRHPNGSTIIFAGENYASDKDLDWMKGLEVNGFLFEEINECQFLALDRAFSRSGRWKIENMPKPIIIATCNPTQGWVKDTIYTPWKEYRLNPRWLYIPAKITDNPNLDEDYVRQLDNMTKYEKMVMIDGEWDINLKTGQEFYKSFEMDKHVSIVSYNPRLALHISWDDNVNPYLPCGIFQIEGTEVRMIDEIALSNPRNTIEEVCKEFIERYPDHKAGLFIYGDVTADKEDTKVEKGVTFFPLIVKYLRAYNPRVRKLNANPSVVARGRWINRVLENELDGIRIIIGENCKKTINDLILIKEAPGGEKLKEEWTNPKTKKREQKIGHFSDLFDYFLTMAFINSYTKSQSSNTGLPISKGKRAIGKNVY
jgi:hypothetical protein